MSKNAFYAQVRQAHGSMVYGIGAGQNPNLVRGATSDSKQGVGHRSSYKDGERPLPQNSSF